MSQGPERPVPHRYKLCACGRTFDVEDGVPTLVPAPLARDKKEGDRDLCNPCDAKAKEKAPWI